jgi:hypothetical protein
MPLQTTFGNKVTLVETTLRHPLGTFRVEGNKVYKYMKAGGTITANAGCMISAAGTVLLTTGIGPGAGWNSTGVELTVGQYFWMQVSGEWGPVDTNTGMTAVGYPVGVTDADGVTLADPASGITAFANCTVAVKSETAGIILLSGLI